MIKKKSTTTTKIETKEIATKEVAPKEIVAKKVITKKAVVKEDKNKKIQISLGGKLIEQFNSTDKKTNYNIGLTGIHGIGKTHYGLNIKNSMTLCFDQGFKFTETNEIVLPLKNQYFTKSLFNQLEQIIIDHKVKTIVIDTIGIAIENYTDYDSDFAKKGKQNNGKVISQLGWNILAGHVKDVIEILQDFNELGVNVLILFHEKEYEVENRVNGERIVNTYKSLDIQGKQCKSLLLKFLDCVGTIKIHKTGARYIDFSKNNHSTDNKLRNNSKSTFPLFEMNDFQDMIDILNGAVNPLEEKNKDAVKSKK